MEAVYRSTCRAQVTKLCNTVSDYLKTFATIGFADVSDPKGVESSIVIFIERLKNAHANLKHADEAMRTLIKQEDFPKECETIIEYDDKAVTTISQLEFILRTHFKPASTVLDQDHSFAQNLPHAEDHSFSGVKLKAIELEKFDGNFEKWLPFWEQFKRAVHENRKLSTAAKFSFLSEALIGRAAATIAGFTPTEKCYGEAISLLQEEYGNNEKIVEKFVQKLINLKPVLSSNDVRGLRHLYNEVTTTMRSLSAFQIPSSQYDIMVKSVLLKSIPAAMRVQFYRIGKGYLSSTLLNSSVDANNSKHSEYEGEQLNGLLNFIKNELEAQEKSQLSEREKKYDEKERKEPKQTIGTAAGLFISHQQQCVFCKNSSHQTKQCRSKLSIDQKKEILRREGRCYRCASKNHNSKFCKAQWVKCDACGGRHITSMCERQRQQGEEKKQSENGQSRERQDKASTSATNAAATLNALEESDANIFLQTAKAIISEPGNKKRVLSRIIMDNGSQRTYISEHLSKELNLPMLGVENIKIVAFGEKNHQKRPTEHKSVEIAVRSQYCEQIIKIRAIVVPTICADILPVPHIKNKKFRYMNLELADNKVSNEKLVSGINILIGQDNYWKFNTCESELVAENLMAVKTFFGWTLQGQHKQNDQTTYITTFAEVRDENFDILKFWDLESIGIMNNPTHDENLIDKTVSEIKLVNGRYVVNLPWKYSPEALNDNRQIAFNRLRGLTNKLRKDSHRLIEYDSGIRDLIRSGIAEEVVQTINNSETPIYYMPHKPVYREDKTTTKMRIVFDASSSEPGLASLNDHLSAGDNMVADLLTTLLRFRSNKIAIIADIEKAFLQISLASPDRDTHRFLWYESTPEASKEMPAIAEYRMTRVTFGTTSSPFLLSATIYKHLNASRQQYGSICDKLNKSFYVDDLILSERNHQDAMKTYRQASEIMKAANFNLRKWNSNDSELREIFLSEESKEFQCQKVLGINWCTASDELSVDIASNIEYLQGLKPTKRNVMKAMAKIYDPLGILGPFTVRIKIILQKIWKANIEWDQPMSSEIASEFQCWQNELQELSELNIQRCLSTCSESRHEIHIFADASPKAYGAVAYVRNISVSGTITTNFICSKNRVSPMCKTKNDNELTLPKLELTAALIAARLKQFLDRSLDFKIASTTLWSDSAITLNWINGQGKQIKPYVKSRVSEINKLTNIYDWRHCEGKTNPADLLTRGIKAKLLVESIVWQHGPAWLEDINSNWPTEFFIEKSTNLLAHAVEVDDEHIEEPLMAMDNFSSLKRLLRVTAFIFRFIKNSKIKVANRKQRKIRPVSELDEVTSLELEEAEYYWIKHIQKHHYNKEISALVMHRSIPSDSKIRSLNPSLDDGIMRLNSRFPEYEFGNWPRNPIILPKHSHFSKLIVMEAHQATMHGGINSVLSRIRMKYWIIKARQLIKTTLQRCVICKRLHGKSASEPWTVLPAERVLTSRPFETTGVDFAGPLYVKADDGVTQRKVYFMLLTCAAIRAVHLELVDDMTTKSCIDALRRFIARRGVPTTIISDNAKTFKRADLELRKLEELMKTSEVQQLAAHQGIAWKFIPERAAWWGGFWERLVRSVKDCLKAAIGKARLTVNDLTTLLTEVESVVNTRPITYITNDHNDLEPLTPSHFFTNCKSILFQPDFKNDGSSIALSWELRQSLVKRYLKRWREDYLNQLRSIHHNKSGPTRSLNVGDVVIIHEDNKPRLLWRLAVVQQTYQGRDGRVRACDIRLQNQQVLKRPIQLLFPLEVSSSMGGPEDVEN